MAEYYLSITLFIMTTNVCSYLLETCPLSFAILLTALSRTTSLDFEEEKLEQENSDFNQGTRTISNCNQNHGFQMQQA